MACWPWIPTRSAWPPPEVLQDWATDTLARPNILMFGDGEWIEGPTRSQWRQQQRWLGEVTRPVVIEIGAGTAIPSVRYFSQEMIHRHGGRLIWTAHGCPGNPERFNAPRPDCNRE